MTTARRSLRVGALAAVVAGSFVLTGCDPVAWARRQPDDPVPRVASVAASPSAEAVVDAACRSDPDESGATVSVPSSELRRYAGLPAGSFTDAAAAAAGKVVELPTGGVSLHDFVPAGGTIDGGVLGPAAIGLIGAGRRTTVSVATNSSTRAADVPTAFPSTNQLSVLRVTGNVRVLSGFTVLGTPQGHLYNGLRVGGTRDMRAADIAVVGVPGDDSSPPGETFGINDFKTVGSEYARIDIDGAGVGAAGFGANGSTDIRVCDTTSHDDRYSMGFAFWQSSGIRLIDCTATDNGFSGFNFERVSGDNTLVRPKATGNRYAMRIASDTGSARFTIVDPQLTNGTWTVTLPKRFYGVANKQRRSDITLIVDGRARPDLLRFHTY